MTTITVTLSEEHLSQLQQTAAQFGVSPEELARLSIEELLSRPSEEFSRAANYVLGKNQDLYQRLG